MDSSKRQARLERRRAEQRQGQAKWIIYIVVAATVLVGLVIVAQGLSGPQIGTYTQKDGVSLGDPSAPVTFIEFADFQCTHCLASYNSVEKALIEQYVESGQMIFIYQPVAFLGPDSSSSAEGAYCAANQNLFWEYHDVLFAPANFSSGNTGGYSEANLIAFAGDVQGMDVDAFSQCMASDEALPQLEAAHAQAQSLARLQQAIEEALAAAN